LKRWVWMAISRRVAAFDTARSPGTMGTAPRGILPHDYASRSRRRFGGLPALRMRNSDRRFWPFELSGDIGSDQGRCDLARGAIPIGFGSPLSAIVKPRDPRYIEHQTQASAARLAARRRRARSVDGHHNNPCLWHEHRRMLMTAIRLIRR
jgi:hypothetical protein